MTSVHQSVLMGDDYVPAPGTAQFFVIPPCKYHRGLIDVVVVGMHGVISVDDVAVEGRTSCDG